MTRILSVASGLCVLVCTLAFARIIAGNLENHREFLRRLEATHAPPDAARTPQFLVGFIGGVVIAALSATGGVLLILRE
jgi:hypothetical protein